MRWRKDGEVPKRSLWQKGLTIKFSKQCYLSGLSLAFVSEATANADLRTKL